MEVGQGPNWGCSTKENKTKKTKWVATESFGNWPIVPATGNKLVWRVGGIRIGRIGKATRSEKNLLQCLCVHHKVALDVSAK
jgi:hypothetical protein